MSPREMKEEMNVGSAPDACGVELMRSSDRNRVRPSAQCRWCPYRRQTRENVFINCPHWKMQQE